MYKKSNINLKDIAYALDVSVNSVSRALRDCSDISETLKDQVRSKALELGYTSTKYDLKKGKAYSVALIFNNLRNQYFIVLADKIVKALAKEGFDFFILPIEEESVKVTEEVIKKCINKKVDAIISFNEVNKKASQLAKLNSLPILLLGRIPKDDYIDAIFTNDFEGGKLVAEYLIKEGCKKICYIYKSSSEASLRRQEGFLTMLELKNFSNFILIDEKELGKKALSIFDEGCDGIFAYNDVTILDFINVVNKNHQGHLLEKVKLVGFDNDLKRLHYNVKLASIDYNYDLIADLSIQIIKERIFKKQKGTAKRILMDVNLVVE